MSKIIIISGSSHQFLAEELSIKTNIPLDKTDRSRFPNRELKVRIHSKGHTCYLLQSFSHPVNSHIIEFLLLADAIKRAGFKKIIAIIPWFGYSKQDKVFRTGEPLSAQVIAGLINTSPVDEIITLDLHNPKISSFFTIPIKNIPTCKYFSSQLEKFSIPESVIVSPDLGASKKAQQCSTTLKLPLVQLIKKRDLDTGEVKIVEMKGNVSRKNVIIYDDIIATGSTILKTSDYLKNHGAKHITVLATHHLYIPGVDTKISSSSIDSLIVTNSISPPSGNKSNVTVLSIASLLAQHISTQR